MSDRRTEKIQPATIALTRHGEEDGALPSPGRSSGGSRGWLITLSSLLLLGVLAVLLLAPQWLAPPVVEGPVVEGTAAMTTVPSATTPPAASPYSEAELAQARRDAQDILAKLLSAQQALEDARVELWATETFAAARDLALVGDIHYRQRDFATALEHYRQALGALQAIADGLPEHLAGLMAEGAKALDRGDEAAATEAFQGVLAIEPDHAGALQGHQRAQWLPRTLRLLAEARRLQSEDRLDEAATTLEELLSLDADHATARQLLADIGETRAERRFNTAMSEGLVALSADRLDEAASAFRRALAIRPGHADAESGLAQATRRQRANLLASQLSEAATLESREQWREATDLYSRLLANDDSLTQARVGEIRSRARAELDEAMSRIIDDPLRLSSPAVYSQGRQLLADARAIADAGPWLRQQIAALEQALDTSQIPVRVRLESDNRTRVTVLRVAELGSFNEHHIDLKPGRYVAVGSRDGYRDVRVEFQVAEGSAASIVVVCRDPV